jgi:2-methyl-3-hydroxypyridine 5-carboxylic acid dioxygenase
LSEGVSRRPRHAEIAGAGFAGLSAAIALRQRGWSVRVHEAEAELRAFGAGIYIWENGLRVLAALDAADAVLAGSHAVPVLETRVHNRTVSKEILPPNCRLRTMTRQHLYRALLDAARRAGAEILTRSRAVGAEADGHLLLEGGGRLAADLVIGADGVKSPVRDSLDLLAERDRHGDGIIRLLVPWHRDRLGPGEWDNVIDFWAPGTPTLRILYTPCDAQDLYLALMAPRSEAELAAIPVRKALWIEVFPQLRPVIEAIGDQGRYDGYETAKLKQWSKGRVALVGDSAHAMSPQLGQGAGCAMMNALGLAVALDESPTIEAGLALWETRERPLTERTQDRAAYFARSHKLSDGGQFTPDTLETALHIPTGTR